MTNLKVLVFGAHPDDGEIFAGGTMCALRAAGADVTLVIATDGSLSAGPPTNDELAARRKIEATAAAKALDVKLEFLGFRDGYLSMASEAMSAVNAVLEREYPDLVITHHPQDTHRDHREISRLVTARIRETQRYMYLEPIYGTAAAPNIVLDTSAHWQTKLAAVREHKSQNLERDVIPGVETWNKFRALQLGARGVTHAEGFIIPGGLSMLSPVKMLEKVAKMRVLY